MMTPTQLIHDPDALESFIQLLSQKKKLEEDHAKASIASKEMEWALQWKRWKLEAAKFAATPDHTASDRGIQQMIHQYENYAAKYKVLVEKVNLAKQVLDFNEKEIEMVGENCLNKLTMEDPFLTVTLREFLYYKSLEREVSAHKSLENYHQKMSLTIFKELLNSETMLGNSLKFQNYVYKCLQDRDGVTEYIEAKQHEVLRPVYGGKISLKVSSTELDQQDFPPTHLLQALWDLMRNPVVEYESHNEGELWDNQVLESENKTTTTTESRRSLLPLRKGQSIPLSRDIARSPVHTPSLENSSVTETQTSSSNDVLTIHRPQQYMSVESLLERGVTARTVPFSAVASEESAITDEAKTRATTATDFEEAIKYSNSNLLEYIDAKMKREAKKSYRSTKSDNKPTKRPTTTTVTKGHVPPFIVPPVQMQQQTWLPNDMSDTNNNYCPYLGGGGVLGDHDSRSLVFENAEVQVSEADLLDSASERPLTFCYPYNYSNNRSYPFYPAQGDR